MKTVPLLFRRIPWSQVLPLFALAFFSGGCDRSPEPETLQGYVEGEFLYIASPLSGALETLSVERGGEVVIGDPLFTLESGAETAAQQLAKQRLAEGRARLEDAKKGSRPPEIAALEAQLHQRHDALTYSESELKRLMNLTGTGAISDQDVDRAKLLRDQAKQRVAQIEAELKTATLGSREDQITEAVANVGALEAALEKADWDLSQKRQIAPRAGRIFDVLYRPGDWVAAGKPVVALLPPDQIKVRAYLPEPRLGIPSCSILTESRRSFLERSVSSRRKRNSPLPSSTVGRHGANWFFFSRPSFLRKRRFDSTPVNRSNSPYSPER